MKLDSYVDMGVLVALELVNRVQLDSDLHPRVPVTPELLADVLAADPGSVQALDASHPEGFDDLSRSLHGVLVLLISADEDAAAEGLNALFRRSPAYPHLAKEDGRWRLHHHPPQVELVSMWTSICAESISRLLSAGHTLRFRACADPACGRLFFDTTRPAARRCCSTTCLNRVEGAELRAHQGSVVSGDTPSAPFFPPDSA